MQPLVWRELADCLEPDLAGRRAPLFAPGARGHDPEHERPRLGEKFPQLLWQVSSRLCGSGTDGMSIW
jgi:hypothetical protein